MAFASQPPLFSVQGSVKKKVLVEDLLRKKAFQSLSISCLRNFWYAEAVWVLDHSSLGERCFGGKGRAVGRKLPADR